jgi:hypothetical protein
MNAIADIARASALQVEAKKHALRQQQDGCWIMTLRVHPNDMPEQIMKAAMGTRYIMALVEIGDDEHPLPPHTAEAAPRSVKAPQPLPVGENKQKRAFGEIAPAQQAGILCNEIAFQKYLKEYHRSVWSAAMSTIPEEAEDYGRDAAAESDAKVVDTIRKVLSDDGLKWSVIPMILKRDLWELFWSVYRDSTEQQAERMLQLSERSKEEKPALFAGFNPR